MTSQEFLANTAFNLEADGYSVTEVDLPSGAATIGYQGKFRWRWMATKLNLFTVVSTRSEIAANDLSVHITESIEYAKRTKGKLRGLQTGVAVIPVLASDVVSFNLPDGRSRNNGYGLDGDERPRGSTTRARIGPEDDGASQIWLNR